MHYFVRVVLLFLSWLAAELCVLGMALVRQIISLGRTYDDDNWTVLGISRHHRCYRLIYNVIIAQTFASSVYSGLVSAMVLELCLSNFFANLISILIGVFAEIAIGKIVKKVIHRSLMRTHKALAERILANSVLSALATFFITLSVHISSRTLYDIEQ